MLHWRCLCFVLAHLSLVWGKLPAFYWFDAKQKLGKLHHADELRNDTIQMVALHICIIFVIFHKLCCIFVKMRSIIPDNPSFRYILHGKTLVTQFNFFTSLINFYLDLNFFFIILISLITIFNFYYNFLLFSLYIYIWEITNVLYFFTFDR